MMNHKNTVTTAIQRHNENLISFESFHDVEVIPSTLDTSISNEMQKFKISKANVYMTKIIGSIMTILFLFVTFAYGQNCTLPLGWGSPTLANGQSRTWYQITWATYTQTCTGAAALLTCTNWVISPDINTFKYASCTPHTWANCTSPTGANHLQYRTLYKANQNTYTQTCQQLSQSLQCLDGTFTGWITPQLYTFASCTSQTRMQCLDAWTNNIMDHGETVIGYAASIPGFGQTCSTLQRTLTCTNSFWSGNGNAGQQWLVTSCTNPSSFSWCTNIRTNTIIPHGSTLTAYTSPNGICANILKPLSCVNGIWSGNGTAQQVGLSSSCIEANTASCPEVIVGLGTGSRPHGSFITQYTHNIALQPNDYCIDFTKQLQCINGTRSGNQIGLHTWCQNISAGSCENPRISNLYTPSLWFINVYTSDIPTASYGCESVKKTLYCNAGSRYLGNASGSLVLDPATTYKETCNGCILPRWTWLILPEWDSTGAYSTTSTMLPKSCNDFSTTLSCNWGILNGNWQTYKYPSCSWEQLLQWIDLTINESPGLPGQENLITGIIAQWSSPQINILFKNKWDTSVNQTFPAPWFLSCIRKEQGLNVYASNPIVDSFVVNAGTKVGINIRIKSLFTQSLWVKTLVCTFNSSTITNELNTRNNTWSWSFEIVEASRFDLALSKSIESISKNLESAEWAKWTQGLQNFLYNKIMNVLVPLIVIIGILSAILWFYKLMFSSDEKAVDEWTRYIIYGVIWIIIIMSARFIGQNIFEMLTGPVVWSDIAQWLYNRIVYPFIKFAIYLVLGAMFVILVTRVITFLFGTDADAVKKAGTLIWWNVISMLIIIWAKQIVQAIYGMQNDVINPNATNLGEIWSGILADKNIPILYQVINYALGIASLVILVVIIIQTVKLLMKPDDAAQIKSIKNSLVYMLLGIFVLGAGYLIVNFAIIN